MTSAVDRQDRGQEAVADDAGRWRASTVGLSARNALPPWVTKRAWSPRITFWSDHDEHAEQQQRRADGGGRAVVDRRLRRREVHLRREHGDAGVAAEQQRAGELPETEQQRHAAAVHEHRPQQRQRDPEEHPGATRAADLRGLEQLGVDVGEARAHEQVDERGETEPGDDHDPRHRVDVDRALLEVVPPRQVAQQGVEVAGAGREQERPADHRRHRRHDDRQDRQHPQQLHARWQAGRRPREQRCRAPGRWRATRAPGRSSP